MRIAIVEDEAIVARRLERMIATLVADCTVRVYDMKKGGEVVFEKKMPQCLYPPNHGVATGEMTEDAFRRAYETVVAEEIGHCFYSHDSKDGFARDSQALTH